MAKFKKIEIKCYEQLMLVGDLASSSLRLGAREHDITCDEFFVIVCQLYNEILKERPEFSVDGGGFAISKNGKELISSLETAEFSDIYKNSMKKYKK